MTILIINPIEKSTHFIINNHHKLLSLYYVLVITVKPFFFTSAIFKAHSAGTSVNLYSFINELKAFVQLAY